MTPATGNYFMMGIGGMGMTPLALFMYQGGAKVRGCDDALPEMTGRVLHEAGIRVSDCPEDFSSYDAIIHSSAISADDPRLRRARAQGVQIYRRGEMLARLSGDYRLLAVVGSHGKTTTAGMLIHILRQARFPFSYVLGGLFADPNLSPAQNLEESGGKAPWLIAEVDESDGTIDHFEPEITLALNFDWDHPDRYRSPEQLENTFVNLFERTRGHVFIPAENERLHGLARRAACRVITFGDGGDFTLRSVDFIYGGANLQLSGDFGEEHVRLSRGGLFNVANATAALAASMHITGRLADDPLEEFPGIRRRQDLLLAEDGLTVLADYAHHPTEVAALLDYAREAYGKPVRLVFQPHRYSRTRQYAPEFAQIMDKADKVWLLPVYAASEELIEGGTSEAIAKQCKSSPALVSNYDQLRDSLNDDGCKGGCLLFVGAGDIDRMASTYADHLKGAIDSLPDAFEKAIQRLSPETTLRRHFSLARKTTMRIGGPARLFAEPANEDDLCTLIKAAQEAQMPIFFLGRGSNLLVHDEGFDGLVVHMSHPHWRRIDMLDDDRVRVGAGVRLQALAARACKMGLSGFEFLEGIPGSVGGALRMNAGAMGGWMFDLVEELTCITMTGERKRLSRDECDVGYRYCAELTDALALETILRSPGKARSDKIRRKMDEFSRHRIESQPREASAGCIFRNPEGTRAGQLIDELGLKGERVGDAEVSGVHGNFIINRGDATCADVLELIRRIRARVKDARQIDLKPEVMLVGKRWEDVL